MENKTNIPKLRFPKFSGEWKEELLEDIAKRGSGHTPHKNYKNYYNGDIPWVSLADSKNLDNGLIDNTIYKISKDGLMNSSAVMHPAGSVLLSRDAGIGKSAVMGVNMAVSQHFIVWFPKEGLLDNWFLYYKMQILKPEFERIAIGSTIKTIGLPYFKKLCIIVPKNEEQQKIASFLKSVDKKKLQLQQKKELLEQYKKGVIQKLFSQQLRFKDDNGNDFPEWEEKELGKIAYKKSSNISANSIKNNYGEYAIYGASGIIKRVNFFRENEEYISIIKDGGVGRLFLCEKRSSVLGTLDIIKNKENTNLYFLYTVLQQIDFSKFITGSIIPHIYFKDYSKKTVTVPSFAEQTKIADFLTAIDVKIEIVAKELEGVKSFKKGLLQQMFV